MTTSVDVLIETAVTRANNFANAAADAIASIDAKKGSVGYSIIGVDPTEISAHYTAIAPDTTPFPVYETPTGSLPANPVLVDIPTISVPPLPVAPTINTAGLFTETLPSAVMPDWNEANPALHVDDIYNDLKNLAAPVLLNFDFPTITPLNLSPIPKLDLPAYEVPTAPGQIQDPINYATYMQNAYNNAVPAMKAFIDDMVDGWIQRYAPEYDAQRALIHDKITSGVNGGVLPTQFEDALYSRARDRIEGEYTAAEATILETQAKRGFIIPPGAIFAGLNKARIGAADSLSNQSTDVYLERRRTEVQHLQFILNLASAQIQNVRGIAIQVAQTGLQLIGESVQLSTELSNKIITVFEHFKQQHEFSLALMHELNSQYEIRLKAALSGLEGFKLELEVATAVKEVELKQVEVIKAEIESQSLQVQRYSAMVDAIVKRAAVDELKIKEYAVRAQVFETQIRARVAAFEAYKAAIEGDKAKLEGELAKLEVYNAQLKAAEITVEVQTKIIDADVETNKARIGQFTSLVEAYRTSSEVALQKFTAGAEIKKLGLDVYKTNVEANLEIYKGQLQADIALINAKLEAFRGNIESLSSYFKLLQGYTEIDLTKTTSIAQGYSNMASATLQSLSSVVSATG